MEKLATLKKLLFFSPILLFRGFDKLLEHSNPYNYTCNVNNTYKEIRHILHSSYIFGIKIRCVYLNRTGRGIKIIEPTRQGRVRILIWVILLFFVILSYYFIIKSKDVFFGENRGLYKMVDN